MWTCPKCNAQFVQKNLWHSCGNYSVERFLLNKSDRGKELFWFFLHEYQKIGPIILHPVKTRVAFMVEVRFSGVTKVGNDFIEGTFWLKEKIESDKFFKIEHISGDDYIHRFRIHDEDFIDNEFLKYMKMAYAIGERKYKKGTGETKHSLKQQTVSLQNRKMAEKRSKLADIKTKPTTASVEDFLNAIEHEQKRKDSFAILEMMKQASGEEPKMWGGSIIGFGNKRYKSPASGREVDWFLIGFSPRKANLSLYISVYMHEHAAALEKLGKHKTSGGCIYINKLADIDIGVLKEMIMASLRSSASR